MADHDDTIPSLTINELREQMQAIASFPGIADVDVLLPSAPGEVRTLGAHTSEGRSMFGPVSIRTSDAVPDGTAYLVDRNALRLDPRRSLQLDRDGSSFGVPRAPDEDDDRYEARLDLTLNRPLDPNALLTNPGPQWGDPRHTRDRLVTPEQRAHSWIDRAYRWIGRARREEPSPAPTPTGEWFDCFECGIRGTRHELGITDEIRSSGLCGQCWNHRHRPAHLPPHGYCSHCGSDSVHYRNDAGQEFCLTCHGMSSDVEPVDPGPTPEELRSTYEV